MNSISVSELKTFSKCPRNWFYSYKRNLTKRQIEVAPDTGTIGHEYLINMFMGNDRTVAVNTFVDKIIADKQPLTIEEYNQIVDCSDLILDIMPRYEKLYKDTSNFTFVSGETKFSVNIPGTDTNIIGYLDAIVKDTQGNLWLMEHKFPQSSFRMEEDLQLDTQIGVYQWVCQKLGFPIVGTIYNQIMAKRFTVPEIVEKGKRLSKVKIYCDWETYCRYILAYGFNISDYMDMEEKLKPEIARRYYIYRSPEEVERYAQEMFEKAAFINSGTSISFMNESPMNCNTCIFKKLCVENLKGGDVNNLIKTDYMIKGSRNKPATYFPKIDDGEEEILF